MRVEVITLVPPSAGTAILTSLNFGVPIAWVQSCIVRVALSPYTLGTQCIAFR